LFQNATDSTAALHDQQQQQQSGNMAMATAQTPPGKNCFKLSFFFLLVDDACSIERKDLNFYYDNSSPYCYCIPGVRKRMYNIKLNPTHVAIVLFILFFCVLVLDLSHTVRILFELS
jgi:hypothetical protein